MATRSKITVERLAVLETEMDGVRKVQDEILSKQDEVLAELARYRGAFGLALLVLSAIGTALLFFKDAILTKLGFR